MACAKHFNQWDEQRENSCLAHLTHPVCTGTEAFGVHDSGILVICIITLVWGQHIRLRNMTDN